MKANALRLLLGVCSLTTGASGQIVSQVVVKSGDSVPGALPAAVFSGVTQGANRFASTSGATFDDQGELTFLWGGLDANSSPTGGVLRTRGSDVEFVLPQGASTFSILFGQGALGGWGSVGGRQAWFAGEPQRPVVADQDPISNRPGEVWRMGFLDVFGPAPTSANRRGDAVFHDVPGNRLGFSAGGAAPTVILETGQIVDSLQIGTISRPTVTSVGTVFAFATTSPAPWALLGGEPSNIRPILYGSQTPGLPAGSSILPPGFQRPSVSHAGDGSASVAMDVFVPGIGGATALFTGGATGMSAVLRSGQSIDRLPAQWRSGLAGSWTTITANTGVLGASFAFAPGSTALDQFAAVVVGNGRAPRAVLVSGESVPSIPGATVAFVGLTGLNRWEDALLNVRFAGQGIDAANDDALMVSTIDQGLLQLVREGQGFEISPGDVRIVTAFDTSASQRNGLINDFRQIAVTLQFADGSDALVRFTIPAPSSAAMLLGAGFVAMRRRGRGRPNR